MTVIKQPLTADPAFNYAMRTLLSYHELKQVPETEVVFIDLEEAPAYFAGGDWFLYISSLLELVNSGTKNGWVSIEANRLGFYTRLLINV